MRKERKIKRVLTRLENRESSHAAVGPHVRMQLNRPGSQVRSRAPLGHKLDLTPQAVFKSPAEYVAVAMKANECKLGHRDIY